MNIVPKPYKHQIEGFNFIKNKKAFALFMEQGTGKSKLAIMKAVQLYNEKKIDGVLIIAPSGLKRQWVFEAFHTHFPYNFIHSIWCNDKTKKFDKGFDKFVLSNEFKIMVVNIEAFQTQRIISYVQKFFSRNDKFIIVDESTIIKNVKAKSAKAVIKGFSEREYKCVLSGTPTPNSPFDIYGQLEFLHKNFFGMSYNDFVCMHGIFITKHTNSHKYKSLIDKDLFLTIKKDIEEITDCTDYALNRLAVSYGITLDCVKHIKNADFYTPYKNLNMLQNKVNSISYICKKSYCLDLPEKVYETIEVELTSEQLKLIKNLKATMYTEYKGEELSVVNKISLIIREQQIVGGHFPCVYRSFQETKDIDGELDYIEVYKKSTLPLNSNPKLKALSEDIERVSAETSIIIWAVFRAEQENIYKYLKNKFSCAWYSSHLDEEEREKTISMFKNKEVRILILSPAIGDKGLNLQVSTLHYFFSNDYRADRRAQAEDRSHRIGQKNKVLYKDILGIDSIDYAIRESLLKKKNVIEMFRNKELFKL